MLGASKPADIDIDKVADLVKEMINILDNRFNPDETQNETQILEGLEAVLAEIPLEGINILSDIKIKELLNRLLRVANDILPANEQKSTVEDFLRTKIKKLDIPNHHK